MLGMDGMGWMDGWMDVVYYFSKLINKAKGETNWTGGTGGRGGGREGKQMETMGKAGKPKRKTNRQRQSHIYIHPKQVPSLETHY